MARQIAAVLYVLALIAVVVSVDILFFRHHTTERLIANVGIVLVFWALPHNLFGEPLANLGVIFRRVLFLLMGIQEGGHDENEDRSTDLGLEEIYGPFD